MSKRILPLLKIMLIFNPASGNPAESALQLVEVLGHLQTHQFQVEMVLVQPELRLQAIAQSAARAGIKMVIVSGGDGTIENVALGLVGTQTTLGIIPTGTRNNIARSLNIPTNNIGQAVALLRQGRRLKIDVGQARHHKTMRGFLEASVIGLASSLYPSADDIQHGDLGKIAEFISTLVLAAPSEIRLQLDHKQKQIIARAHLVIIANMPFMGANFQVAPDVLFDDRYLDVFVYSDLGKIDLIGQVIQSADAAPDERIQRFRAKKIAITTIPAMSVIADGVSLGDGSVTVTLLPRALKVMAGPASVAANSSALTMIAKEAA
ncbi:MAG: YegS/Rv2252/BmrU family lipid kinase [Chloroflexota bacterium]